MIGVSSYQPPFNKLPGVAKDVREVAKVLASRNGTFPAEGVTVLTDKLATRDQILAALKETLSKARSGDTVFVHFAGHGAVEKGAYYFVPYDAKQGSLVGTGLPLAEIKGMFDATASKRVFLWLDFCHSGGMTQWGRPGIDLSAIRREISVVTGEGKVIVAACTSGQYAYEDSTIGHGIFTYALLRGLKGEAKNVYGEVTALSLYEFIHHEVKRPDQQPTFFGQLTGPMVLAYYPSSGSAKTASIPAVQKSAPQPKAAAVRPSAAGGVSSSGNLVLLNSRIYATQSVHEASDGKVVMKIAPRVAEEEAALRSLRNDRYGSVTVGVAFGNQAFSGRIDSVTFNQVGSKSVSTVTLTPEEKGRSYMADVNYGGVAPQQMAEMRARVLLLDEKPSVWEVARDTGLRSFMMRPLQDLGAEAGIFPILHKVWKGSQAEFPKAARLWAMHYLKASGICDEILELKISPVRSGKVSVRFRGNRRNQYSAMEQYEITLGGTCIL